MGRALRVVKLYGILRFLADVDRGRDFTDAATFQFGGATDTIGSDRNGWRDRPWNYPDTHIVADILDWASGEGFPEVAKEIDSRLDYRSAREFRERHILGALKSIGEALGGR